LKKETNISLSDRLTYYAVIVIEKLLGILPTSWVWRFGALLGSIMHCCASKRRKIVAYNLRMVHPGKSDDEIIALTKKVFRYSMANLTSSINTGFISDKKIEKLVTIKGQEHITGLDPDKGVIFMLTHMSNWEILGRTAKLFQTDKPTGAMYRPLPNPLLDDFIRGKRELAGTRLFSRKRGLIEANKFLRDGGILGILSDQHAGNSGVHLPLFGKETSITPLPTLLAQKYDCPIIPIVLYTESPGRWTLECRPPFTLPSKEEADKTEATKLIVEQLEEIMQKHSADIFWIHDRWKIKHLFKKKK